MSARRSTLALRPSAGRDIRSILLFTVQQWGVAQRNVYGEEIARAFESLSANPQIGRARDEVSPGLRSYQVRQHVIYYRIASDFLTVLRILHERMDARKHLSRRP